MNTQPVPRANAAIVGACAIGWLFFAFFSAVLLLPTEKTSEKITRIERSEDGPYRMETQIGHLTIEPMYRDSFSVGLPIEVERLPLLGDFVRVTTPGEPIEAKFNLVEFVLFPLAGLVVSALTIYALQKQKSSWFAYWFFTLVCLLVCLILLTVTRF